MSHDPNVSMGGGSFDFDAENSGGGSRGPGGGSGGYGSGGGSGGWSQGSGGSGRRRLGIKGIIGIVVVLMIFAFLVQSCTGGSRGAADCGDYDLVDGKYVSAPNSGDYERNGNEYDYVGCDTSRSGGGGGGFFFLPFFSGGGSSGSNYGDGSGFRGGGPGTGK